MSSTFSERLMCVRFTSCVYVKVCCFTLILPYVQDNTVKQNLFQTLTKRSKNVGFVIAFLLHCFKQQN